MQVNMDMIMIAIIDMNKDIIWYIGTNTDMNIDIGAHASANTNANLASPYCLLKWRLQKLEVVFFV